MNRLFSQLKVWQKGQFLDSAKSCDSLAVIALRITSALVNDTYEPQQIASNLSLVLEAYQEKDLGEELAVGMALADQALDKNLRGFSGLLHWVLGDHRIRRDPKVMLKKVVGFDRGIINSFKQLSLMLEAYFNLRESFAIKAPKVSTLMFLSTLATIFDAVLGAKKGARVILRWLKERVKNDEIVNLYQKLLAGSSAKELLVLDICQKSATGEFIKAKDLAILDEALLAAGMLGLKPLVESGFLMLEQASSKNLSTNKVLKGCYIASGKLNGQSTKTS